MVPQFNRFFAFVAFTALVMVACDRSHAQEGDGAETEQVASESIIEGANYRIELSSGEFTAGQAGELGLRVIGTSGFHVNVDFPIRVSIEPTDGLEVALAELRAEQAHSISEDAAVFGVGVTPRVAGQHQVEGSIRFSVCSESRCDVPEESLAWGLTASAAD